VPDIERIDIAEFRKAGFLQEVNRQFFHPLGLALEVVAEEDGSEHLGGVWDYRDDPEGIVFAGDLAVDREKVDCVAAEHERHRASREALMEPGRVVQKPGETFEV
jgi:hypothetical protein